MLTQRLKEVVPQIYIERTFDLPVNCWMGSLHLSYAVTVTQMLESRMNLVTQKDGVRLVKNKKMKMLDAKW